MTEAITTGIQGLWAFANGIQGKDAARTIWDQVKITADSGFPKRVLYAELAIHNLIPVAIQHCSPLKKVINASPLLNLIMHGGIVSLFFLNQTNPSWIGGMLSTIQIATCFPAILTHSSSLARHIRKTLTQKELDFIRDIKSYEVGEKSDVNMVLDSSYPLPMANRISILAIGVISRLITAVIEEVLMRRMSYEVGKLISVKVGDIDYDSPLSAIFRLIISSGYIFKFIITRTDDSEKIANSFVVSLMLGCFNANEMRMKFLIFIHTMNSVITDLPFLEKMIPLILSPLKKCTLYLENPKVNHMAGALHLQSS